MVNGKKIVVVMPAFNAAKTLKNTYADIPFPLVDEVLLVDDFSSDHTLELARQLGIKNTIRHPSNQGYGANQKTCYDLALKMGADIVVMLHPDYQYNPKLIPAMVQVISEGIYPVVMGSRILGKGAIKGGMPRYKYIANRILTLFQNLAIGQKLSEYHSGYRAFSREVLLNINYRENSDDFVFDNQVLCQVFMAGYEVGEITCPTRYFPEASSINFSGSISYGAGVIKTSILFWLHKRKWITHRLFLPPPGQAENPGK